MPVFEIWADTEGEAANYVFHGYGDISKYDDPDDDKLKAEENNDSIHRFSDGSYTVVGSSGNTYGDAYEVSEMPYAFNKFSGASEVTLRYADKDVTKAVTENDPRPGRGRGEKLGTAIREFVTSEFPELGGTSGTEDEEGNEDSGPTNYFYGGGSGYPEQVEKSEADYVVTSKGGVLDAASAASSGDIIFVDGDAEIDMGADRVILDKGVTIASDRGKNGSDGALLYSDDGYKKWASQGVLRLGADGKAAGLRVKGPLPDEGFIEYNGNMYSSGVEMGENAELENCEVSNANHCVHLRGDDCHVHHSSIHHANMQGVGYSIGAVSTEGLLMEYCHTYHFRHVVGATGAGGFEARYNIIDGPALAHAYDQHAPGGTYTKVHHNTQRVGDDVASGDPYAPLMTFRGDDVQNGEVYNNWAYNPRDVRDDCAGFTDEFLVHAKDGGTCFQNIEHWDNHLGQSAPEREDVGAPRPYNV